MVSRRLSREAGHRRKFLAIIDETPECERAVAYASRRAKNTGGVLVLLYVIEPGDFQHWLGVEKIMREEANATAAAALDSYASKGAGNRSASSRSWSSAKASQPKRSTN